MTKTEVDIPNRLGTLTAAMSKKITLTGVLVVILLLSAIANVALCVRYVRTVRTAQRLHAVSNRLQVQTTLVVRNRNLMQSVANEASQYAKKNTAMAALVQQYGPLYEQLNLKPSQSAAPKSPTR